LKTVLVTGASSGIGAACAVRMRDRGWRVLAGVRRAGTAPEATDELLVDVTEPQQLELEALHGLINNAGVAVAGPLEFLPPDELRRQLEVNVVGQLRMTQLCLSALRAGHGRVVNMGSISGRNALPFLGAYAMSKFALEAMTDALRIELAPWGIQVAIIEPGTIKTPIWTRERPPPPPEAAPLYGARIEAFRRLAVERGTAGAPPETVADAVEHALTAAKPRTRYLVGRDAKLRARVERLPDRIRDRVIVRRVLGA
jgi:NAD(P)-dependent dehydrogenase (short-subunit alcohol dehydrogenase family)